MLLVCTFFCLPCIPSLVSRLFHTTCVLDSMGEAHTVQWDTGSYIQNCISFSPSQWFAPSVRACKLMISLPNKRLYDPPEGFVWSKRAWNLMIAVSSKHLCDPSVITSQILHKRSGSVVECLTWDRGVAVSSLTGITVLCPWARHINSCLVLVQPRKTCPDRTEKLLTWT